MQLERTANPLSAAPRLMTAKRNTHFRALGGKEEINNEFKIAVVVCLPTRASVWDLFLFLLVRSVFTLKIRIVFS